MFGKETKGLPEDLLVANPEHCVRLPMRQGLRSLNLSNTVAVAVYEILRQGNFEGLQSAGELTQYSCDTEALPTMAGKHIRPKARN